MRIVELVVELELVALYLTQADPSVTPCPLIGAFSVVATTPSLQFFRYISSVLTFSLPHRRHRRRESPELTPAYWLDGFAGSGIL